MRYIILVLLNLPIILLALLNIVTQYKMKRATRSRFIKQLILWLTILVVFIGSFPLYNYVIGQPILNSIDLSAFDIVQTTAIVFLFYIINDQRQKTEQTEHRLRDLHQELSIKLSILDSRKIPASPDTPSPFRTCFSSFDEPIGSPLSDKTASDSVLNVSGRCEVSRESSLHEKN